MGNKTHKPSIAIYRISGPPLSLLRQIPSDSIRILKVTYDCPIESSDWQIFHPIFPTDPSNHPINPAIGSQPQILILNLSRQFFPLKHTSFKKG